MLARFLCIVPSDYRTSYIPCDDRFAAQIVLSRHGSVRSVGGSADFSRLIVLSAVAKAMAD